MDGRAPSILINKESGKTIHLDEESIAILNKLDRTVKLPNGEERPPINNFWKSEYDIESVPLFKEHKICQLNTSLREAVDLKYKISLLKGTQLVVEQVIILVLMVSIVMKANVFSFIYLLFVVRYIQLERKQELLVKLTKYMSIFVIVQYLFCLLNLHSYLSPIKFPDEFTDYPVPTCGKNENV